MSHRYLTAQSEEHTLHISAEIDNAMKQIFVYDKELLRPFYCPLRFRGTEVENNCFSLTFRPNKTTVGEVDFIDYSICIWI